jgi:HEAT repeat protein
MRSSAFAFLLVALCARALGAEPPAPAPAASPAVDVEALVKDLTADDVDARRKAAYALWGLFDKGAPALPALATALADDDEYVRTTAEKALLKVAPFAMGRPEVWTPTFQALVGRLKDKRPAVRRAAAMGLWSIGTVPEGAEALTGTALALLSDEDADLRANGAGMLANVAGVLTPALQPLRDKAVGSLLPLAADKDDRVRRSVADALGQLGMPEGMEALFGLAQDPVAQVRAAALPALGGMPANEHESVRRLDVLRAALFEADPVVRTSAANALWSQGVNAADALADLLKALREDPEANVRAPVVAALGTIGERSAIGAVRRAVDDAEAQVRSAAVMALAEFGPEAGPYVPLLVHLLRGGDAAVKTTATFALGRLGHVAGPAVPALLRSLADEAVDVRFFAANALWVLSNADALPPEAMPALLASLPRAEARTVSHLAQALAAFPSLPASAGPVLRAAFAAERATGRPVLLLALARVEGPAEETLALARPLAGTADVLALDAAFALVMLGGDADRVRGLALLEEALERPDGANSLWLLGEAGSKARQANAALVQHLQDLPSTPQAKWSRLQANAVLARIGGFGSVEAVDLLLRTLLESDDLRAAASAADALGRIQDPPAKVLEALVWRMEEPNAVDDVAPACVAALRRLGRADARTLAALSRLAEHPRSGRLRLAAGHALLVLAGR